MRITLKAVAAAAGVSVSAASHAVNRSGTLKSATRDHILREADRLGYVGDPLSNKDAGCLLVVSGLGDGIVASRRAKPGGAADYGLLNYTSADYSSTLGDLQEQFLLTEELHSMHSQTFLTAGAILGSWSGNESNSQVKGKEGRWRGMTS